MPFLNIHRTTALALAAAVLCAGPALAQESPLEQAFINLTFPGGTASEYVETLRNSSDNANIVVLNDIDAVVLPEIVLRQVTLRAAVEILAGRTDDIHAPSIQLDVEHDPIKEDFRASDVFVIEAQSRQPSRNTAGARQTSVFTIDYLVQGDVTADDVLSAIELALSQVRSENTPPDIKYHEPTAILIARGNRDQLHAIERVLESIELTVKRRMDRTTQHQATQQQADEKKMLLNDLKVARVGVENLKKALGEAEHAIAQRELRISALQVEIERLHGRLLDNDR